MNDTIYLVLIAVALILAGVDLMRSKAQSLTAWGVLLIAAALIFERVA